MEDVYFGEARTFADLQRWLADLPDQAKGDPCSVCQTGENYIEFHEYGLARPDDVAAIEAVVVQRMIRSLTTYLNPRKGRIYWRVPLEFSISETDVAVRFDDNGPEVDFVTNRKCVKDHNWRRVACYCRLYRANLPTVDRESTPAIAA